MCILDDDDLRGALETGVYPLNDDESKGFGDKIVSTI